jgi:hypothetical protein
MSSRQLPEFSLTAGDYGWSAHLPPDSPRFFGMEILLQIDTRMIPSEPEILPAVSPSQASLVRSLIPALPSIVQLVERELAAYSQKHEPEFRSVIRRPYIWLSCESDDGVSWTFIVERTDNSDFGYHAEFRGTDFVELWAGD